MHTFSHSCFPTWGVGFIKFKTPPVLISTPDKGSIRPSSNSRAQRRVDWREAFSFRRFCTLSRENQNFKKNICILLHLHKTVLKSDVIPKSTVAFCYPVEYLHFCPGLITHKTPHINTFNVFFYILIPVLRFLFFPLAHLQSGNSG